MQVSDARRFAVISLRGRRLAQLGSCLQQVSRQLSVRRAAPPAARYAQYPSAR
ncbi:hypothetical protein I553_7311 [Mycobacterium xenopi 4042]|uniref:Uncharacterized protein n=1 Tax=Mycobacterium xenopi 4042 TaxID=1299334 RepID=X8E664_MYCXE|nr:hypothetical protein I553_7311 [Mycobacterium xenopi 4042]